MLFFFSYARADLSPFLQKFYNDLRDAVRSKAGEPDPDKIAFRDAVSIEPGRPWPEMITKALCECKVFVFLHTPTYYARDGCGKEFRVIKDRVKASRGEVELAKASCIQPIYWDGEKKIVNVPPEVAHIQLTHDDYGEAYSRQGMLQISRASYNTQLYWDAVDAIARRIQAAAQNEPLVEVRDHPEWEHIPALFPSPALAPPTQLIAAQKPIRPPTYARFVWIVAKRDELAQTRRVQYLECYDPYDRVEEWRPFLPDTSDPARLIATDAAREVQLAYHCAGIPRNRNELQQLIEQAGDAYTPIVIVSDLWSLRLAQYQDVVRVFDKGKLDNCAVIFPWNLKDYDTNSECAELRQLLNEIFPVQFHKPETSLLFEGIFDVFSFKAEVSKLLTKYVADINRSMKAARELPETSAFRAPPQLGPTSSPT